MRARDRLRQIATLIAVPFGVLMNVFPIGGGDVASAAGAGREIALDVAGYAFGIWFLIFFGQLAYMAYQALPAQRENPVLRRVGGWAIVNSIAQGLWPLAVLNGYPILGWALILVMLSALIGIEARVGAAPGALGAADRWLVRVPYSVNLGWISVATVLSTLSVLFNDVGWSGAPLGQVGWGLAGVFVAAAAGFGMLFQRRNVAYAVVIVWALVGVAVGSQDAPVIAGAASVLAVLLGVAIAAVLVGRSRAAAAGRGEAGEG